MSPHINREGSSSSSNESDPPAALEHPPQAQSNNSPSPTSSDGRSRKPTPRTADLGPGSLPANTDGASFRSTSPDTQLGSPGSISDRVFPIRSVVFVDPSQTPRDIGGRNSSERTGYFPPATPTTEVPTSILRSSHDALFSEADGKPTPRTSKQQDQQKQQRQRRGERIPFTSTPNNSKYYAANKLQLFRDDGSSVATIDNSTTSGVSGDSGGGVSLASGGAGSTSDSGSIIGLVTARFKHVVTADGHAVITGRDGETPQRCEDEPIHIPGAVQGFGLLIALEEKEDGQFIVRVVSENSHRIIGYHPHELFKLKNFCDILSEEQQDNLLDHVDFIRDEDTDPASNGPEVFTISIRTPKSSHKKGRKLWCAMHINPVHADTIICEFELVDDQVNPLVPTSDATPEVPEDTLNSNPTEEEYADSTNAMSKPLRVLRSARKRKGEAAAMEVFNIMSQVQEQLASAPNLDQFLKILVGVVKELTGFHRVMCYQFDASFNGRVVTELVDPRATKDLYKGLNFPASDIPKQARDLYKVNKVRLLYDRDLETARLVCRSIEDLETPLDLSFSYLRAMSPIHLKYLANMAVRSSMSISINAFGELWGLIACHSYGSKGMRVSFPIRKMCRLIGDTASRNIERLSYASRLQARKLINTVPTEAKPSGYIIASSEDLLKLFDADFGLLSIHGETKILGRLEHSQEALAMLEYLRLRKITSVVTSQDIKVDFPDLMYQPGFNVIAGLLFVPLSVGGTDFITFFRRGVTREVKWAGNPYEKFVKEGTESYLEPRKSFRTWSETVVGKCRDWTEEQVETAAVLCLVYGKFIEVWRQKEAALQSSQLTKLLLANSAHEVRTPLNAIINYLEIALEGSLDQETRENLAKSHSASKSLIYVINDLLDLTKTEEGQDLIKDDVFDFYDTLHEATDSFRGDAKRRGLDFNVYEHPGLPQFVHGDQRRIRQVISNVIANAMQHTTTGSVRIETYLQDIMDNKATIEVVIQDTGVGMSDEKLDALFRDLEQLTTDEHGLDASDEPNRLTGGKQTRTLGLGLAMVARIVRTMDGQLRLKSEEGKGSRFVIQIPFLLPDDEDDGVSGQLGKRRLTSSNKSVASQPPRQTEGEVTLVEKNSSIKSGGDVSQKKSTEEINSLHSFKSASSNKTDKSVMSDVDRLIDAISTPFLGVEGETETEETTSLQRSNSKGSGPSRKSNSSWSNVPLKRNSFSAQDKPETLNRSRSYGTLQEHLRSPQEGPSGSEFVQDNKTLLRAVRMPDEFNERQTSEVQPHIASKVSFEIPPKVVSMPQAEIKPLDAEHLQVLVAEDDPVNSRIIKKRMEKSGHVVHRSNNGEECAAAYADNPALFDVVLMDMQMPIVDGLTSAKMIRAFETTHPSLPSSPSPSPTPTLSPRAQLNSRVPIFAVSASLVEGKRQTYISAGFDGWILKPIDFKRLNIILNGIVDEGVRESCLYRPGEWECGGWFKARGEGRRSSGERSLGVSTSGSRSESATASTTGSAKGLDGSGSLQSSDSGSMTPVGDGSAKNAFFYDERLGPVKEERAGRIRTSADAIADRKEDVGGM